MTTGDRFAAVLAAENHARAALAELELALTPLRDLARDIGIVPPSATKIASAIDDTRTALAQIEGLSKTIEQIRSNGT